MGWLDAQIKFLKKLTPAELKKLASLQIGDLLDSEIPRARGRVGELKRLYPSAQTRELGQRLIDQKKAVAGMVGGVSGVFGLVSVPADLLVMAWLQLSLLTELATLYGVNLKSERSRNELFDFFGYANGVGPVGRTSPKLMSTVAARLLERGGLHSIGRALPLVAAPVTAYLNNKHIQEVGDEALRHYEGFGKAREKTRGTARAKT
jgi:uncharacterized protein (DUF697 family)